ncbi:patatin-like phospholipase family protein [Caldimonas sp. KR1-144]|uniref:patatin-like phospholipase family protein n=1 Tax=Caldimonas sp. KR1-144 TaxID=3400911 RepID=UPI003C043477
MRRCLAAFVLSVWFAASWAQAPAGTPLARPKVGLVLSGGGARGLAHVGVLKVLERERVPIDVIAGTSMGAIIGGLYASGMSAEQLERELLKVDWDGLFASRVSRQELSQRRKEEDYEIAPAIEVGLRDGEFRVPLGTVSSRGLELLLRRYTLAVRDVRDFDRLPTPFRAVATDMETGQPVVFKEGDLALALRSSMSVPGVFSPTEIDGRILGDGGLVDNVPVDVARAMGADIVIVVNVGTPLAKRETLGTLLGVTAQMINILTEQNVQRSLASLTPRDLLITPPLGSLTSADFARSADFFQLGELQANAQVLQLGDFAVGEAAYRQWAAARAQPPGDRPPLAFVRFEGSELTHPERFAAQLETQPGLRFDPAAAERDVRRLAASGDYDRVDFQIVHASDGVDGVVFALDDKAWGPNYFKVGLDLSTDFSGESDFNIKISHNRHWLDANGSEWRNIVQIGSQPTWFSEFYRPLRWSESLGWDWFIAPAGVIRREQFTTYAGPEGPESGRLRRTTEGLGLDLGQPWGQFGELRLGAYVRRWTDKPLLIGEGYTGSTESRTRREQGLRVRATIDQLDYAFFPQSGYRVQGELAGGALRESGSSNADHYTRFEGDGSIAFTMARRHTVSVYARTQMAGGAAVQGQGLYNLGGFQNLSGYKPGQVEGNYLVFGRLSYYYRLAPVALTRGMFAGVTLEAGNAWSRRDDVSLGGLRSGFSAFLGADTGIGPLYFGLAWAPRGDAAVYLFLGRP